MDTQNTPVKALFLTQELTCLPDSLVCSGLFFGKNEPACPWSVNGRMPDAVPLDAASPSYSPDKGNPGDLCPPCVKCKLGELGHWNGQRDLLIPEELKDLRLFKCNQWLWLVLPGLLDSDPQRIAPK